VFRLAIRALKTQSAVSLQTGAADSAFPTLFSLAPMKINFPLKIAVS
jgi:hypothetical protein